MNTTSDWLKTYDRAVPRYTSYPTAPQFTGNYGAQSFARDLADIPVDTPISLYVHMPFCKSLCWYCGCNMKVSRSVEDMLAYSETICREIALVRGQLKSRLKVSHIHFGGGTPTWGPHAGRTAIMQSIRDAFDVEAGAEIAFEADPRAMDEAVIQNLADLGVNRVSLGVQDFDAGVQAAINRIQPFPVVARVAHGLRQAGIDNINLDLMYGLPLQTEASVSDTLDLALSLEPQRVALFGYAHVPWMKKHQRLLERAPLPNAAQRLALFNTAQGKLLDKGFVQIGIDHFAAPDDDMARAALDGSLNRNFQGYSTDTSSTIIGFGASAISGLPTAYAQNDAGLKGYISAIRDGGFATVRGRALTADDVARRDVIMDLMCHFRVRVPAKLAQDVAQVLAPLVEDGLCRWEDNNVLVVADEAKPWVRVVAACFDAYHEHSATRHARAV